MARNVRPAQIVYDAPGPVRPPWYDDYKETLRFFDERLPDGTRKGAAIVSLMVEETEKRGLRLAPGPLPRGTVSVDALLS